MAYQVHEAAREISLWAALVVALIVQMAMMEDDCVMDLPAEVLHFITALASSLHCVRPARQVKAPEDGAALALALASALASALVLALAVVVLVVLDTNSNAVFGDLLRSDEEVTQPRIAYSSTASKLAGL